MHILGISCYYHDAAAAILRDGQLIAAAEEERFSRVKHDSGFPKLAIDFCLKSGGTAGSLRARSGNEQSWRTSVEENITRPEVIARVRPRRWFRILFCVAASAIQLRSGWPL